MNSDFKDLLRCLNEYKVKYLVIGGYAVSYYSEPRYTKDLDLWVEASLINSKRIIKALSEFGAPVDNLSEQDFASPNTLFVFGIAPNRVDILTKIKGVSFSKAWTARNLVKLNNLEVPFISIQDLKVIKKVAGRPQDKIDLQKLKKIKT